MSWHPYQQLAALILTFTVETCAHPIPLSPELYILLTVCTLHNSNPHLPTGHQTGRSPKLLASKSKLGPPPGMWTSRGTGCTRISEPNGVTNGSPAQTPMCRLIWAFSGLGAIRIMVNSISGALEVWCDSVRSVWILGRPT